MLPRPTACEGRGPAPAHAGASPGPRRATLLARSFYQWLSLPLSLSHSLSRSPNVVVVVFSSSLLLLLQLRWRMGVGECCGSRKLSPEVVSGAKLIVAGWEVTREWCVQNVIRNALKCHLLAGGRSIAQRVTEQERAVRVGARTRPDFTLLCGWEEHRVAAQELHRLRYCSRQIAALFVCHRHSRFRPLDLYLPVDSRFRPQDWAFAAHNPAFAGLLGISRDVVAAHLQGLWIPE